MRPSRPTAWLFALIAILASAGATGGGSAFDGPDEHGPDEGPAFWGFVKDARGAPVQDAKVSLTFRSLTLLTRTNAIGAYRVRGFRNDVVPAEVTVACAKDGYRQVRVFRRPPLKGQPVKSVETECRLQRE